jgi:hypothetical protein
MKMTEITPSPHLFLDCDGVLADFDAMARGVFEMPADEAQDHFGQGIFWKTIRDYRGENDHGFYRSLPLMPDAMKLFNAVKHLKPTILTGCPFGNWAPPQKMAWAEEQFPGTKMITCMARDKITHLENPGDVLVDDKTKFQPIWEKGGGIFVHHTDAESTLVKLREIYPYWFERTDRWTPENA